MDLPIEITLIEIIEKLLGLILLYGLGLLGWYLGIKIKLPAAPVLGGVLLIGSLRVMGLQLPFLPQPVVLGLQIMLGVMVGSRLDRQAMKSLKTIALPAVLISTWAVTITLVFGFLIAAISGLETTTAILGSSIGGLPEMTVLAEDTGADTVTVVMFHILRVLSTMLVFPFILSHFSRKSQAQANTTTSTDTTSYANYQQMGTSQSPGDNGKTQNKYQKLNPIKLLLTLAVAGGFGGLLILVGVPAGGLVGGMVFIIIANYFEFPVEVPPRKALNWFLVGIGLMVSNEVSPETMELILSGELVIPLVLSVTLTLASSFGVAYLINKLTGWEYTLCFLASAPAGFTVMTGFALNEGYDPVRVSLLHLSRLVTLKLVIPFLFMIFY
ncbi:AbrB family transcriptional regulator [Natranaerobius thermophilus]|uniref:Putative ammonia monooxygenase-like protein n=1 Tax=Natranaerobius thermophilus (strain ATCC BAA-1301 / DSM 18059 / JW/NM-WN-LF) TaxID=457570 RepID=B2A0P8_NATTJ|nr:AbrB family transcriptional regulator [Natranaerobius thermophilus]ACB85928.1 Putative ammonia monooxygenase-like protein [Natranaerobius thermophilus JW/NM-WN-LF]